MGVNCLNYMNQEAIDQAIEEHNEKLGEELYKVSTYLCGHCLGHPFSGLPRICYKPRLEVRIHGTYYAIYDILKEDFARSDEGLVLTRDSLPSAKKLMAGVERAL